MAQPYVGEIRMFAGNFPPVGWMFCDGQLLPISENDTLFTLIGTTYGGDGESTFALPNLQSRVPIHMGSATTGTTYQIGEMAGVESVTLSTQQIPNHTHAMLASEAAATALTPQNNMPAEATKRFFVAPTSVTPMAPNAIGPAGGSQPHENCQPFLCVNFIISLFGIFPSQT
ncbi:phage tail protein [Tahibacter amnicola]|uniref:Tail fiber protein n=1 Tax=Tahibacter amnicola TaxID=2976241 RepID=A0ABY6BGX4_9GAMM|nr:tail fiber protein [Tahibacter amnicola]UXI69276.1 tail fiber protein [Tahibacter amnicola]